MCKKYTDNQILAITSSVRNKENVRLPCSASEVMLGCPIRLQIAVATGQLYINFVHQRTHMHIAQFLFLWGGGRGIVHYL